MSLSIWMNINIVSKNVLTKLHERTIINIVAVKKPKKYVRVHILMPESLYERPDNYCNSIIKGSPRIRSTIIRNAIEEFLDKQEGN